MRAGREEKQMRVNEIRDAKSLKSRYELMGYEMRRAQKQLDGVSSFPIERNELSRESLVFFGVVHRAWFEIPDTSFLSYGMTVQSQMRVTRCEIREEKIQLCFRFLLLSSSNLVYPYPASALICFSDHNFYLFPLGFFHIAPTYWVTPCQSWQLSN